MTERPVIVTTEYRGVFFGYATDTSGDTIHLKRARNALRWSDKTGGFMGLAERGPGPGDSRIGAPADIELRKVTSVVEVTPEAERVWVNHATYISE